ncbi:MAG: hypothetical protein AAGD10_05685 [Myxococcota bacterium]
MFRFLYRVLLFGVLVWGSFVLEYQGKPVRWYVQDWAAGALERAWPIGRELARDVWMKQVPSPEEAARPSRERASSRVKALAEARERIAPAKARENLDYDRPQSAKERRELDERLQRGLR